VQGPPQKPQFSRWRTLGCATRVRPWTTYLMQDNQPVSYLDTPYASSSRHSFLMQSVHMLLVLLLAIGVLFVTVNGDEIAGRCLINGVNRTGNFYNGNTDYDVTNTGSLVSRGWTLVIWPSFASWAPLELISSEEGSKNVNCAGGTEIINLAGKPSHRYGYQLRMRLPRTSRSSEGCGGSPDRE
jgi:hypothetical protein